ncbi:hypothetical protein [Radiobacillus sp. PE A8.2]
MLEIQEERYCEQCGQETPHLVSETALEITYQCKVCNQEEEVIKTFF